jgi:hypothetical protein
MFIGGGIDLISWGQQTLVHTLALIVLYVSLALGMFVWGPMQIVANFREVAEVRAGYTTMRDAHQDVQEVEPGTFRLVRQAGEPYITEEQRLQRLSSTPGPYVNTSPGVVAPAGKPGIEMSRGTKIVALIGVATLLAGLLFRFI